MLYTSYFILENVSTNVRQFRFPLLYLTRVTSCIVGPFLCCHLMYLIIYIVSYRIFFYAYPTETLHIRPYPILLLYLVVVYIIIIQLLTEPILSNHEIKADFKLYIFYLKSNHFQKINSIVLYSFSKTIYFKIGNSQQ